MFSGGLASPDPDTRICSCTVSPTAARELRSNAVTFGGSASAQSAHQNTISAPSKTENRDPYIDILLPTATLKHQTCLPVVIDMARGFAFIELDALFFILHRLQ